MGDAGPVFCHQCHLIVCNSVFLLQNKITLCVCKCMHIWEGGTVPKDCVHADKPRLASGSLCLHSKETCFASCSFSPPFHPLKNSSMSSALQIVEIPLCRWICIIYLLNKIFELGIHKWISKVNMLKSSRFHLCGTSCHVHPFKQPVAVLHPKA